jgi:hypothetical protein
LRPRYQLRSEIKDELITWFRSDLWYFYQRIVQRAKLIPLQVDSLIPLCLEYVNDHHPDAHIQWIKWANDETRSNAVSPSIHHTTPTLPSEQIVVNAHHGLFDAAPLVVTNGD